MSFTVICNTCKKQRVIENGFADVKNGIDVLYHDENDTILVICTCNNEIESDHFLHL